jgi:hypothetical protein
MALAGCAPRWPGGKPCWMRLSKWTLRYEIRRVARVEVSQFCQLGAATQTRGTDGLCCQGGIPARLRTIWRVDPVRRKRHAGRLGRMKSNQAAAAGAGFAGEGMTAAGAEVGLRFRSAAHAAGLKVCISVASVVGTRKLTSTSGCPSRAWPGQGLFVRAGSRRGAV